MPLTAAASPPRPPADRLPVGRRVLGVLSVALVCCLSGPTAPAQPVLPFPRPGRIIINNNGAILAGPADGSFADESAGPVFVSDRAAARRLRLAEERATAGHYEDAADLLQPLIEAGEDTTVAEGATESGTFQSVKSRALELIAGLPPGGRQAYELKYGSLARARLTSAIAAGDRAAVEEVARRYFHTDAGREAAYRSAASALDRGESLTAALRYRQLSGRASLGGFGTALPLRAATAWRQAGLASEVDRVLDSLPVGGRVELAGRPAVVPGRTGRPAWFNRALGENTAVVARPDGWPMLGGRPSRNGETEPATPAGGPAWSGPLDPLGPFDDRPEARRVAAVDQTLEELTAAAGERTLTQPAFHPLIVGDLAVFRTFRHLRAVDLTSGETRWHTQRPLEDLFDVAVGGMRQTPIGGLHGQETLLEAFTAQRAWRDITGGTLSTDGRFVYAIEGIGLTRTGIAPMFPRPGQMPELIGSDAHNQLYAYDLAAEGRIAWAAGGPSEGSSDWAADELPMGDGPSEGDGPPEGRGPLDGVFFLGPPLPIGDRLYVLAEQDAEVRLLALDATAGPTERLAWSQTLVRAAQPVTQDPLRRLAGASPAFADGLLVCPTAAGAVVAVDPGRRVLRWGYQYPRRVYGQPIGRGGPTLAKTTSPDDAERWLDAVPLLAEGVAVLTPRDSDELHVLDLSDGKPLWRRPRGDALYAAAVQGGKVILVGRESVSAFNLRTGEPAWPEPIPIPPPAGRGFRSGASYHLPLSTGEIATLQLDTGRLLARSPVGGPVGNLAAAGGAIISVGNDSVCGFRPLARTERDLRAALQSHPDDPIALALRGELRLHRGEDAAGIDDLRHAANAGAPSRTRQLLIGGLLDGLRADFPHYRGMAGDVRRFGGTPQEQADALRLTADGLMTAGERVPAFVARLDWLDLLSTLPDRQRDEPHHRPRGLRVPLAETYGAADTAERTMMDRLAVARLDAAVAAPTPERLRDFAVATADLPIGMSATRALAQKLLDPIAAAAVDAPGLEREQLLLTLLTTGSDLTVGVAAELAALDHAARPTPAAPAGFPAEYEAEFAADEIGRPRAGSVETTYPVEVAGSLPAAFDGWQFEIEASRRFLIGIDPLGRPAWRANLIEFADAPAISNPMAVTVRFRGHLMAVTTPGRLAVFDLLTDPTQPRRLWDRRLSDPAQGGVVPVHPRPVPLPGGRRRLLPRDLFGRPVDTTAFAGDLLLYRTGEMLLAADPLSGKTHWTATIPVGGTIGGDRQTVIVQPSQAVEATLLRPADGVVIGRRATAEASEQLGWLGTLLIVRRADSEGITLTGLDVVEGVERWTRRFGPSARHELVNAEELAVLDAATGAYRVIRLRDGLITLSADLPPMPGLDHFLPLRWGDRSLLFTHAPEPPGPVRTDSQWALAGINGPAYAFDALDGRPLWSADLRRWQLTVEQPAGLPFLFLTAKVFVTGGRSHYTAGVLDLRTGRLIFERERQQPFTPFRVLFAEGAEPIGIAVPDGRVTLTPPSTP